MHVSTRKISMISALCFVAAALACFSTDQVYALSEAKITIVNNLDQSLVFKEIKNRQDVQIKSDPPAEIPAHSSGEFKVEKGSGEVDRHLNVKYFILINNTAEEVGIVYKCDFPACDAHCPKEHPDWTTETVHHCGNWDTGWTYTFAPQ